jgi:hypothetical protein
VADRVEALTHRGDDRSHLVTAPRRLDWLARLGLLTGLRRGLWILDFIERSDRHFREPYHVDAEPAERPLFLRLRGMVDGPFSVEVTHVRFSF